MREFRSAGLRGRGLVFAAAVFILAAACGTDDEGAATTAGGATTTAAGTTPTTTGAAEPIKIGYLYPLTGAIAASGLDAVDGSTLYWEQHGYEVAGRPVEVEVADTACDPDTAISQARRLIELEGVHFLIGPLCGHVGPAVAQVSQETGVPLLIDISAANGITARPNKRAEFPTVVRLGWSASQVSHPFGEYVYSELGCRNATVIGQDYTFGQENAIGAMVTFEQAGGRILDALWTPIGTTDYGPILGSIPGETDCVLVMVVGADRLRLFEQWFEFGMDQRFDAHGIYWMQADVVPELDDRAVGLISMSLNYLEGIDTPTNKEFADAFATKYGRLPAHFAEGSYTASVWATAAIEEIGGNVEDSAAFLDAVRSIEVDTPRGPLKLDEYDNPIQNVYVAQIQKVDHPVLGETLVNVPIYEFENISQFWTWDPEEFFALPPYDTNHPLYGR